MTWPKPTIISTFWALLVLAAVVGSFHVHAQVPEAPLEDFRRYLIESEVMVLKAVEAYEAGRVEEAFKLARDAYINYFELLEIPLRAVDPQFVVEMELKFAELRSLIKAGESPEAVRSKAVEILDGLERVEFYLEKLSDPEALSRAAGVATFISASIIVREGLEAVVLLSALYASVIALRRYQHARYIALGVAISLPALAITWIVVSLIVDVSGVSRSLAEALLTGLAIAVIAFVAIETLRTVSLAFRGAEWLEFAKARVWEAVATGRGLPLFTLSFILVYREGFEAILLYQVLLRAAEGLEGFIAAGFILGVMVVVAAGIIVAFLGVRVLPFRAFAIFSAALVGFIFVMLTGNLVDELQDLGLVSVTPLYSLANVITPSISDLTGLHPTLETIVAQALAIIAYIVVGTLYYMRLGASGGLKR